MDERHTEIDRAAAELSQQSDDVRRREALLEECDEKLKQMEVRLDLEAEELRQRAEVLETARKQGVVEKAEIEVARAELDTIRAGVDARLLHVAGAEASLEQRLTEHEADIADREAEAARFSARLSRIESREAELDEKELLMSHVLAGAVDSQETPSAVEAMQRVGNAMSKLARDRAEVARARSEILRQEALSPRSVSNEEIDKLKLEAENGINALAELGILREDLSQLRSAFAEQEAVLKSRVSDLANENKEAENRAATAEAESEVLEARVQELFNQARTHQAEANSARESALEANETVAEHRNNIAELKLALNEVNSKLEDQSEKLATESDTVATLQARLEFAEKATQERLVETREVEESLRTNNRETLRQLEILREELAAAEARIQTAEAEVADAQADYIAADERATATEKELQRLSCSAEVDRSGSQDEFFTDGEVSMASSVNDVFHESRMYMSDSSQVGETSDNALVPEAASDYADISNTITSEHDDVVEPLQTLPAPVPSEFPEIQRRQQFPLAKEGSTSGILAISGLDPLSAFEAANKDPEIKQALDEFDIMFQEVIESFDGVPAPSPKALPSPAYQPHAWEELTDMRLTASPLRPIPRLSTPPLSPIGSREPSLSSLHEHVEVSSRIPPKLPLPSRHQSELFDLSDRLKDLPVEEQNDIIAAIDTFDKMFDSVLAEVSAKEEADRLEQERLERSTGGDDLLLSPDDLYDNAPSLENSENMPPATPETVLSEDDEMFTPLEVGGF